MSSSTSIASNRAENSNLSQIYKNSGEAEATAAAIVYGMTVAAAADLLWCTDFLYGCDERNAFAIFSAGAFCTLRGCIYAGFRCAVARFRKLLGEPMLSYWREE